MPATKLAAVAWFSSAAAVMGAATASVIALAGSNTSGSGTGAATAKPSPSASANGNGQGNDGNGAGNGGSTGTQANNHPITLTGNVVGAPAPGKTATLNVLVDNSKNQAINIRTVTASVTSVTSRGDKTQLACDASWYVISGFSGSKNVVAGATAVVPLTITFVDKPVKQDNCKGATFNFNFTASADQA